MSIQQGQQAVASDFIASSAGAGDAGKGIKADSIGKIDNSFLRINLGDGSDGDVTISSPTTLTRDMFYNNLTINSTLTTNGYCVYVKNVIDGNGTIEYGFPNNGTNASGTTGGAAGASSGGGRFKTATGSIGANGATSGGGGPSASNSADQQSAIGVSNTVWGGSGGADAVPHGGGSGGGGGLVSIKTKFGIFSMSTIMGLDFNYLTGVVASLVSSSGGGGGGGGACRTSAGGAGGGGAAAGGIVFIVAYKWAGTFTIKAIGGNGGNGSDGAGSGSFQGGGGGGGAGGNGGTAVIVYSVKTWTGGYNLAGGSGGNGGAGWVNGGNGGTGLTGNYYQIDMNTLTR